MRTPVLLAFGLLLAALLGAAVGLSPIGTAAPPRGTPVSLPTPEPPARVTPTSLPTPEPPAREEAHRKGAPPPARAARFPSRTISFSRLLRVEEVDLDGDGVSEALVDGIGTVHKLGEVPAIGFVSRSRLPFESPLLAVLKRSNGEWHPLLLAHVPLRCGQRDDPSTCDQLLAFRSVRFRFDDRPQVVFQMLRRGDSGLNESYAYRLVKGRLEPTFSVSLPQTSVSVSVDPNGIERRLAVDTFINRDLPPRFHSFTLKTFFVFGKNRFRIAADVPEEPWSVEKSEVELAYWGLVHQPGFAADLERLKDPQRRDSMEAWAFDPVEVVRRRYPDSSKVRIGTKAAGLCVVYFELPNNCQAHALLYQPLREWEGEKSFWEIAMMRGQREYPFECFEEPPVEPVTGDR
ncbi:MAG TPA: hypothetical protein VOA00_07705 [Thermoanaerobaculia bacterium]|nr:hypothetical protein [Thermoanaerobaculia bacterium]